MEEDDINELNYGVCVWFDRYIYCKLLNMETALQKKHL